MSKTIAGTQTYTSQYTLTDPAFQPLYIDSGARLTNATGTALLDILSASTIHNAGFVAAAAGVGLLASGNATLTNAAGGTIAGYTFGVSISGAGSVLNQGSIYAGKTLGPAIGYNSTIHQLTAYSAGIELGGGALTNAADSTISSPLVGVSINGGSVDNAGAIIGTNTTAGYGVILQGGGSVTNQSGGQIAGGAIAVFDVGPLFLTNQSGGTISGGYLGVLNGYRAGYVTNQGVILGDKVFGIELAAGGAVYNQANGEIAGGQAGVYVSSRPGTVTNHGMIHNFNSPPNPANSAGKAYHYEGVGLGAGGTVTNLTGGHIFGYSYGVRISGAAGTVTNAGTITSYRYKWGAGVQLDIGGSVTNSQGGLIAGEWIGVQLGHFDPSITTAQGALGTMTLVNQGNILAADGVGDGAAVWMYGPGTVINDQSGIIAGATHGTIVGNGPFNGALNGGFGIVAYYQTTLVNYGSIGGNRYSFDATNKGGLDNTITNRIEIAPSSSFGGEVKGSDGIDLSTLELLSGASAGSVTSFGKVTVSGAYYSGYVGFGTVNVDNGATWSLGGTVAAGTTIAFAPGGTGALTIVSPTQMNGTIADFHVGDTLALAGVTGTTGVTPVPLAANDELTVAGTGLVLQFDSSATGIVFAESVSGGETTITALCFLPDTLIQTPAGQVKVQNLAVGDLVTTAGGSERPITWIGTGQVLATRGRRGPATPVIVRKGALAPNVPMYDLRVTKGHSIYLDGVLIPVEFLVNHRSIVWDDLAQEVRLYHVELETHDVLLANGAPAESYRDDGNRWLFQNANSGWEQPIKPPCALVLTGGPIVDAVWRRLLDRAGPRPGWPLTDDPDLCVLADGVRVNVTARSGTVWAFALPRRPAELRIASRSGSPQELGLARDPRVLGVALKQITLRQGARGLVLDASDERLGQGFHEYEAELGLRWTDGDATLPASVLAGFDGPVQLELEVAGSTRYSADRAVGAAA
jgi:Hint domain